MVDSAPHPPDELLAELLVHCPLHAWPALRASFADPTEFDRTAASVQATWSPEQRQQLTRAALVAAGSATVAAIAAVPGHPGQLEAALDTALQALTAAAAVQSLPARPAVPR